MIEEWRPVVGYPDHYEISSMGRVRRILACRGATAGRILRQVNGDGYRYVHLYRNDKKRKVGVHILVAEAFHGKRPRGKLPNHMDLCRSNNSAKNLEWLTQRQNVMHAISAGRHGGRPLPGMQNGRAKLTAAQVAAIKAQKGKVGQRTLASLCGVSKTCIQLIHQGKNWTRD
jgi:hypothetical protein